ncbi:hypothetical protein AB833_00285 [Chromatiales bacterium (ex Bugula neritina AB1)]|nr:hypothetical protein AB833_00285 [Chromatiales bacterium (ex Bugula neritina AB1)]
MAHAINYDYLSFEDYLAGEKDVDIRSEYIDGQVYAMAGASERHNTIASSLSAHIEMALKDGCRVWQSDMKIIGKHQGKNFAYYPDITAACGENTGDQHSRTNPILIIEVLSPSTERIDRTEKMANYTSIDSLMEYVLVSQSTPFLTIYRRRNNWRAEPFYAQDDFTLESVELTMKVEQVYRRVRKEVGLDLPGFKRET